MLVGCGVVVAVVVITLSPGALNECQLYCARSFTWGEEISSSTSSSVFGVAELLHLILEKLSRHGIISYQWAFLLWMLEGSSLELNSRC